MVTMPEEEAQRVRSYLLAQANRLSIPELVAKVRSDTAPLQEIVGAVPAARFAERPGPDDWSAAEVCRHVLQTSERAEQATAAVLDNGAMPPRNVAGGDENATAAPSSASEFWDAYAASRERLFARVLQARGDEHLEVKFTHPNFGELSWREWLLFMRVHDLDHMRQLQAITEQFGG